MHRLIDRTIFSLCITQPTTHLVEKTNAAGLRRINRFPLARVVDVNNYFYRITIKTDDVDYICDQEKHTSPEWIEILVRLPPLSLDLDEYEPWALNGRAVYDWLKSVQSSKGSFTFYEWLNEFRPYWNKANEATMSVFFVAVIKKRIESLRCGDASIPGLVPVVSYLDYSSRVVDERTMGPKLVYGGHLLLRGCVSIPHKPVSEDRTYVPAPLPKDGGCTVKRVHICKDDVLDDENFYESDTESGGFEPVSTGDAGVEEENISMSIPEIPRLRATKSPEGFKVVVDSPPNLERISPVTTEVRLSPPPPAVETRLRRSSRFQAPEEKKTLKEVIPVMMESKKKPESVMFEEVEDEEWGDKEEKPSATSKSVVLSPTDELTTSGPVLSMKVPDFTKIGDYASRRDPNAQIVPDIVIRRRSVDPNVNILLQYWNFIEENITFSDEKDDLNFKAQRLSYLKFTLFFENEDDEELLEFRDIFNEFDNLSEDQVLLIMQDLLEPSKKLGFYITHHIFKDFVLNVVANIKDYFNKASVYESNDITGENYTFSNDADKKVEIHDALMNSMLLIKASSKTVPDNAPLVLLYKSMYEKDLLLKKTTLSNMLVKSNLVALFRTLYDGVEKELNYDTFKLDNLNGYLVDFIKFYETNKSFFGEYISKYLIEEVELFEESVRENEDINIEDAERAMHNLQFLSILRLNQDDVLLYVMNLNNILYNINDLSTEESSEDIIKGIGSLEKAVKQFLTIYDQDNSKTTQNINVIYKKFIKGSLKKDVDDIDKYYKYVPYYLDKKDRDILYRVYDKYKSIIEEIREKYTQERIKLQ